MVIFGFLLENQDCHYLGADTMLCSGLASYRTAPEAPAFLLVQYSEPMKHDSYSIPSKRIPSSACGIGL